MRKLLFSGMLGLIVLVFAACGTAASPTQPPAAAPASDPAGGAQSGSQSEAQSEAQSGETQLTTTGMSFRFQYSCINRTLNPCEMADSEDGFIKRISDRTQGQVQIQLTSFPELGLAGPDTLRLVSDGTLEMAEIYSGYVGGDFPIVDIANLWGLYPDTETHLEVIDAISEDINRIVGERAGGVVLGINHYDNNFLFSKRSLTDAQSFRGLKTRSHSTVLGDLVDGIGGEAQFVAFSEVYTALERGILDAAVSSGTAGAGLKWYEATRYLAGPIVSVGHSWITVNKGMWDRMPPDIQQIMREEIQRHHDETRRLATMAWEQEGIDENVAQGMEYQEFPPEVIDALRQAAMERVLPNWVARVGGPNSEAVQIFNEKVAPILGVRVNEDGTASEVPAAP